MRNSKLKVYVLCISVIIIFSMTWQLVKYNNTADTRRKRTPRSSSNTYSVNLRPNDNVQNQWSVSNYTRIDDNVEKPAAGDGKKNTHDGNYESVVDIFDMQDPNYTNDKVISINIHLRCQCLVSFGGYAKIKVRYRFGSGGSWSLPQTVSSPFGMAWKSFSWSVSDVDQSDLQELQVSLAGVISANKFGGFVAVDVMYASIEYQVNVKKFAVIVGISDYKTYSDLGFCDEDATDWFKFLNGTNMSFDQIWVYGDNHPDDYPQHDGIATEYNIKLALTNMVDISDNNDIIAFISNGHGDGDFNGASYLCMWDCRAGESGEDGNLTDTELTEILNNAVANRIFIFLGHCLSGGFGLDLINMSNGNHIYCTTTCTESGYGYEGVYVEDIPDPIELNCAWDYYFLEHSWISEYNGSATVPIEEVFSFAASRYIPYIDFWHGRDPHGSNPKYYTPADYPQEFDGDPSTYFYLT